MPYTDEKGNLVLTNRDCALAYMPEIPAMEAEIKNLKIQNSSLLDQINRLKDDKIKKYFVCSDCITNSKTNFAGIIEAKEKEISNMQAKLKRSESLNSSSTWSKEKQMQIELDDLRRRANIAGDRFDELRKTNSQIFAERDKLKDKVFSLEVEINMMKEKATQDRDNSKAQDELKKIEKKRKEIEKENAYFQKKMNELKEKISLDEKKMEKERKEFAKKFSEFSRKAFEEKKSMELKCIKLSQTSFKLREKISEQRNNVEKDFEEERKVFETEIAKLNKKLSELSTNILKEKNAKAELHKKFDLIAKERNCLSTKIKELEEIMFKVKLTGHKTPKSIAQSPRDDLAVSECSFKSATSSIFPDVSNNPFFDVNDNHTSILKEQIHPSNLFYDKNVDGSGNIKKSKSQQKRFWRRKDEKDKENWI
ncbi:hypothetical protein L6452_34181 [Arctium lappa]|uniref:Uncharacterized protein n=1 Tax=Arctium lappa TaxID=4217 RepID=A0ACB8YGV4_ARCLA|nr:hypothetical protein L6452_34181 [Arctium lappa]